jgi:murein L,D-transpeptidase YafK
MRRMPRSFLPLALALAAIAVAPQAGTVAQGDDPLAGLPAARRRLEAAATAAKVSYPLEDVSIRVEKKARRLTLLSRGKKVLELRVGLGFAPAGHKEREGDGRTPEGDYYLCTRNEKSRFHLFLGISYPGPLDAEAGLRAGRIDAATAAKVRAVRPPACPPWKTPLGGEVGIHGRGASRDWTAGCVALENADMDVIWVACPLGTPVRIEP